MLKEVVKRMNRFPATRLRSDVPNGSASGSGMIVVVSTLPEEFASAPWNWSWTFAPFGWLGGGMKSLTIEVPVNGSETVVLI